MQAQELFVDTHPHMPPPNVLEGLETADAERRLPDAPHSIAEIIAHMSYWQEWFCQRAEGTPTPIAAHSADGWPLVLPESWPEVRARFLSGLERVVALAGRAAEPVTPPIESPALAGYTIGAVLVHVAQHNSHHIGQVIVLRQLMGLWPPPSGSWTW